MCTCLHVSKAVDLNSSRRLIISSLYKGNERKCVGGIFCLEDSIISSILCRQDDTSFLLVPAMTKDAQIQLNN